MGVVGVAVEVTVDVMVVVGVTVGVGVGVGVTVGVGVAVGAPVVGGVTVDVAVRLGRLLIALCTELPHPAARHPVTRMATGRERAFAEHRMSILPRRSWQPLHRRDCEQSSASRTAGASSVMEDLARPW